MLRATINGFSMHYQLHGPESGEPLVLVHGYTGDIGDWFDQIDEFSKTHRVLVLDHRGHGDSEGPADISSYTIVQMADDVEALVDHVGFERYHLVGHSMGGGVAQEIALRRAERLLSLTLFGTGPDFQLGSIPAVVKWMEARNKMALEQGMTAVAAMPQTLSRSAAHARRTPRLREGAHAAHVAVRPRRRLERAGHMAGHDGSDRTGHHTIAAHGWCVGTRGRWYDVLARKDRRFDAAHHSRGGSLPGIRATRDLQPGSARTRRAERGGLTCRVEQERDADDSSRGRAGEDRGCA